MNILSKALLATAIATATATAASACTINYREGVQVHRIVHGATHGSLTIHEFGKLAAGQAKVRAMERQARMDGYIDPWECNQIQAALNVQSVRIFLKKHN